LTVNRLGRHSVGLAQGQQVSCTVMNGSIIILTNQRIVLNRHRIGIVLNLTEITHSYYIVYAIWIDNRHHHDSVKILRRNVDW